MPNNDTLGQADLTPPEGQGAVDTQEGQVSEPFFKYEDQAFKSPDELKQFIKSGTLMQSDYTKKTQSHAEEKRKFENDRADWNRRQAELEEKYKDIQAKDDFLRKNPAILAQLKKAMSQGASGQDIDARLDQYVKEKIEPKLGEFEKWKQDEERRKQKAQFDEEMKGKYADYDPKAVDELYQSLFSPDATMGTMIELLYHAHKGKNYDPAKAEATVLQKLDAKKNVGIPGAKGGGYSGDKKPKELDMRKLAEKLKAEAGD